LRATSIASAQRDIRQGSWLNTLVALIIPPGQSVQDGVVGKDIYTAFAVRLGLLSRHRRR
jgi:hypothetical protein